MAHTMLRLITLAAAVLAQGQAPWPQPYGSASHSRAIPVAWLRGATAPAQLNTAPLCSPVLIGANGTLYGAASDGLLHAFAPSGLELWVVTIGEDVCSQQLALNDEGSILVAYLPSSLTRSGSGSIGAVSLSDKDPVFYNFQVNGTVLTAAVSRNTVTALVGWPVPPLSNSQVPIYAGFVLNSYNLEGVLQWSHTFGPPFPPPYERAISALAVKDDSVFAFATFCDYTTQNNYASLGGLSLTTGELLWHHTSISGLPPLWELYIGMALTAPSASVLLLNSNLYGQMVLYALDATTGNLTWGIGPQNFRTGTDFAASLAGDFLALFSSRVETETGNLSQLPVPPVICDGTVFLDTTGALFCVMGSSPGQGSILLAFDILTGRELLSAAFPFAYSSLAFSASGQLFVGSEAGLFTFQPSATCTPSPPTIASRSPTLAPLPSSLPPAAAAPSVALSSFVWGALGGACAGVASSLAVVAAVPRLRACLAQQQLQPPAPGTGGPAFAAGDYAQLN
jgi:outer membrane protein assembly factor BamB